jgi:hypothetical protein
MGKVLSVECDVPEPFITQTARNMLNNGTLPKSVGSRVAQVDEKDTCMLLLGIYTATKFADASDRASQYAKLKREGEEGNQTFLNFLVKALKDIRNRRDRHVTFNDRARVPYHQLRIEIITSYPLAIVSVVPDFRRMALAFDGSAAFSEEPQTAQFWPSTKPRRSVTIPGDTLFAIVNRLFGVADHFPAD